MMMTRIFRANVHNDAITAKINVRLFVRSADLSKPVATHVTVPLEHKLSILFVLSLVTSNPPTLQQE
jgi:hypothetical protein